MCYRTKHLILKGIVNLLGRGYTQDTSGRKLLRFHFRLQ
jgi:hypothetical protein